MKARKIEFVAKLDGVIVERRTSMITTTPFTHAAIAQLDEDSWRSDAYQHEWTDVLGRSQVVTEDERAYNIKIFEENKRTGMFALRVERWLRPEQISTYKPRYPGCYKVQPRIVEVESSEYRKLTLVERVALLEHRINELENRK